jgi:diphosphomevalonate decarboxylase
MIYWNSATIACMQTIRELQEKGAAVFFTIDAGPQLKAICSAADAATVRAALAATAGVVEVMQSGVGDGARLAVA